MEIVLNDMEVRVLGSLIEKKLATPDYYPLSLNALTNACNQKSNREPVVSYDEQTVQAVLDDLERKRLVSKSGVGRVPKYEECLTAERNLVARESSVLCVLFLRGPQTPGMIRAHTARLHDFESLEELQETLSNLEQWGYAKRLPRLPGHKESRYVHLLCGEPATTEEESLGVVADEAAPEAERIDKIEHEIATLRGEVEDLKKIFEQFKREFE
jgi:uncharacterized protein YceH (UPF0502 family)